jgi:hypothetical protein
MPDRRNFIFRGCKAVHRAEAVPTSLKVPRYMTLCGLSVVYVGRRGLDTPTRAAVTCGNCKRVSPK